MTDKGHTRELLLLVGESGSGKSTYARQLVATNPKYVRLNRDDLRIELAASPNAPKGRKFEQYVAKIQRIRAAEAFNQDKSVIIDDTNLNSNTRAKWEDFARHRAAFRIYRMTTSLEDCIANDLKRFGTKGYVGEAVVYRQFLMSKRIPMNSTDEFIIVDVDGTIADHTGIRGSFDEDKVLQDRAFQRIIDYVNEYAKMGYKILIVSGRHSTCGPDTITWLHKNNVHFDFIFMRHGWDNRHDYIVKQEILDELLQVISKEQIACIYDDRPQVGIKVWQYNQLPFQPVYKGELIPLNQWTIEHDKECSFVQEKGYGRCPDCGAFESF